MQSIIRRLAASLALLCLVGIATPVVVYAAEKPADKAAAKEKPTDISNAVTQSYNAAPTVQIGMIVQLNDKDSTSILPVTSKNMKKLYGVVIPVGKSPIVLSPTASKQQQVLVTTTGRQEVLVSNQNGPVKIGDYVTVSAIDGIGMKAGGDDAQVLGKVASNFSGSSNVVGSVKLKDTLGKETAVAIGRVQVDVNAASNPLSQTTVDYVPGFLSGIAISVASKPVSVARIYLATVILVISGFISGNVLYSGVRGGMVAVGRNPLSKKSIIKSLIQTVMAGLIIFVVGVFAVYLILKL